ncbi:MAG TPA: pitrilysin family protein [Caulobacteraceae bacterium]|jgi:zinc protease
MRRVAFALVAALALGAGAAAAQTRAEGAAVTAPPIQYQTRTLANGLKVFTSREAGTSNVSVQVWYHVGGKDDPQGRSGFAHLFEHLLFKSTRNMPSEFLDRLTEDVGGYNNASTHDDLTNYYEVVPAEHLERLLWAEADRMQSLVVDEASFRSEREVVKEEYRQGVLADPYGRLFVALPAATFTAHPYRRSVIGDIAQLDAATLEDVKAFHATYYRPDNAALIVVGNFDQARLDRWVDQYFGPVRAPKTPIPRVTVKEPQRTSATTKDVFAPNVPLPAVALSWVGASGSSPDAPALKVLEAVLTKGESSRLYRSLVYEQQLAQSVFGGAELIEQPGQAGVSAILAGGKTVEQGETALRAELAKVRDAPVGADELARAKTLLVSEELRDRQAIDDRGNALGFALILQGGAERANEWIGRVQAVTAADVQRVARLYLPDDRRVVVRYQEGPEPAAAGAGPAAAAAQAEPAGAGAAAAPQPRPNLPPLGQPAQAQVPAAAERVLPNGLRVVVARSTELPLVTARLIVRAGGAVDPQGRAGLASLTASLLPKGAGGRSAPEVASAIGSLGAELEANAGWDGAALGVTVMRDKADAALAILADVAVRPALAAEELERLRTQSLDALQVALKEPGSVAGFVADNVVLAGTPYGHVLGGTPGSLKRITREDVRALHSAWYRPDNAILVLTGKLTPEEGLALAQRHFGGWARPASPPPAVRAGAPGGQPRVVVVDLPGSGQAAVAVALSGIRRSDPRYFPAVVTNATLGVGFSSRLNQEIRIKRGLSYGARAVTDARRFTGPIVATSQTKNESAPEVVELMLAELGRLGREPAPEAELLTRKAVLTGGRGRALETTEGLAGVLGTYALQDLPLAEVGRYDAQVRAVDPAAVRAYASAALDPARAHIIVVGDAKQFLDRLRAKHPQLEVVAAAQLDLDSPALRTGAAR